MKKYSVLFAIFILAIILIAGCGGGGGTTGVVPNNVTTNPADPTATPGTLVQVPSNPTVPTNPTIPSNLPTGNFKVEVKFPGAGSDLRAKELTGSDLPYNSHTLRVTITGEAITTTLTGERTDLDPKGAGTYTLTVSNVPVGLNTATIEVLDPSGNLLCQRKHGFYMTPGTTEGPGLILLGIAIQGDGSYVPQNIDIPAGSTLMFQNHDYNNDRTVSMNTGAVTVGPIGHASHITQPVTAEVFPVLNHVFNSAGQFNNDGQSGRVLVYGLPTLTSVTPDKDSTNGTSTVSFTLTGTNFGTSQTGVNGAVRFIQAQENDPNNPWGTSYNVSNITSWGNTSIAGNVDLPAGKYRIEVSIRGENTTEAVYLYKGTGNYQVTVGGECFAYVTNKTGAGITYYQVNKSTGALTSLGNITVPSGNSAFAIEVSPNKQYLYVSNNQSSTTGPANIVSYSINSLTGVLTQIGTAIPAGNDHCARLVVHPNGRYLYASNYNASGPHVYSYNIESSGGLSSYIIPTTLSPQGNSDMAISSQHFMYVALHFSTGAQVAGYQLDSEGIMTAQATLTSLKANQSNDLALHPNGNLLYESTCGGLLYGFKIAGDGTLSDISSGLPSHKVLTVAIEPSGKYIYCGGCQGHGNPHLYAYSINQTDGSLTYIQTINNAVSDDSQNSPAITIAPSGKFLYITRYNLNRVDGYSINASTGVLTSIGSFSTGNSPRELVIVDF